MVDYISMGKRAAEAMPRRPAPRTWASGIADLLSGPTLTDDERARAQAQYERDKAQYDRDNLSLYLDDEARYTGQYNPPSPPGSRPLMDYASILQDLVGPTPDLDPYGANRTAEQRLREIDTGISTATATEAEQAAYDEVGATAGTLKIDPMDVFTTGVGWALPALGLASGAYGAYRDITDADKMRAGIMPPEVYAPQGFWDSLMAAWPDFLGGRSFEENLTDEDVAAMRHFGMGAGTGGDVGAALGARQATTPLGTDFGYGTRTSVGPVDTGEGVRLGQKFFPYKDWGYMGAEQERMRNQAAPTPLTPAEIWGGTPITPTEFDAKMATLRGMGDLAVGPHLPPTQSYAKTPSRMVPPDWSLPPSAPSRMVPPDWDPGGYSGPSGGDVNFGTAGPGW